MGLAYNQGNWKSCLESLGFTERKNSAFGGMVIFDDHDLPKWTYDTEEEKKKLYLFFSGAAYWKLHTNGGSYNV